MKKIFLLLCAALLGSCAVNAQDKSAQLAVIIGKSSQLDNVSSADLAKIFKAEKAKAPDGTRFVITMLATGLPERDAALKGIYGMSEAEYGKFFLQATFTGAVQAAPKNYPSAAALKQFVAATPGAIGYIRASDLDDTVKAVKVDDRAPGDADYKLTLPAK